MSIKWVWVNSVSLTPRMMMHLHTKHKDGFRTLMHYGVKNRCLDVIHGDKISWNAYNTCVQTDIWVIGWQSLFNCVPFTPLYIFCVCYSFYLFVFISFLVFPSVWDFVGISSTNPHKTLLVHLGEPSGLKSLLHTLNATVIPAKVS